MANGIVKWFDERKGYGLSSKKKARMYLFTTQGSTQRVSNLSMMATA